MKKSLLLILAIVMCFTIAGCKSKKVETEKLTKEVNNWTVTINVPKDKGYKFVEEIDNDNEYAPTYQSLILDGDKVRVYFEYNSNYLDMGDTFKEFVKERGDDDEIIDFNGRDAIKIDYNYGAGSGDLKGYQYLVDIKELKAILAITILPTEKDGDIKALLEDPEVKVIKDSIKIEVAK